MLHTIENGRLTVSAQETGAQLMSIRTADGTEYLWQGDPAYWSDRALNLFPYVARLRRGQYELDGKTYGMRIHGFAPYSRFALAQKTESSMTFELRESMQTLEQYPFRFAFRVTYSLEGSSLTVTYRVENRDDKTMYFGLGGHPGFNVPLERDLGFEDYRLRFEEPCTPVRVGFDAACLRSGEDMPYPLTERRILALRHDLFDEDAIVLRGMSRQVTLEAAGSTRSVTVSFPDMPYLGIWHMPHTDAPYVCIEPWRSLPAMADRETALEEQEDLVRLERAQTYENTWMISIGT